jgi:hypothetical protein
MGRPTVYSQELADKIIKTFSNSAKSFKKLCEENDDFPQLSTVYQWSSEKPDFSEALDIARVKRMTLMGDELSEISDETINDPARDRLRVQTRQWLMSKYSPNRFGEASKVEVTNKPSSESLKLLAELISQHARDH